MRKVGDRVQSSVIDTSSQTEKLLSERACRERLHEMIEYPKALPQYIPCWRFFFFLLHRLRMPSYAHTTKCLVLSLYCVWIVKASIWCFLGALRWFWKKNTWKTLIWCFFSPNTLAKAPTPHYQTHTQYRVAMIVPSTFSSFLRYSSAPSALVALLPMKMNWVGNN